MTNTIFRTDAVGAYTDINNDDPWSGEAYTAIFLGEFIDTDNSVPKELQNINSITLTTDVSYYNVMFDTLGSIEQENNNIIILATLDEILEAIGQDEIDNDPGLHDYVTNYADIYLTTRGDIVEEFWVKHYGELPEE